MARINIEAKFTAPAEVNIPLVRGDISEMTNTFRIFFEVFLSIFATLLGHVLAQTHPTVVEWVFFWTMGLTTAAFLLMTVWFSRKSRIKSEGITP